MCIAFAQREPITQHRLQSIQYRLPGLNSTQLKHRMSRSPLTATLTHTFTPTQRRYPGPGANRKIGGLFDLVLFVFTVVVSLRTATPLRHVSVTRHFSISWLL